MASYNFFVSPIGQRMVSKTNQHHNVIACSSRSTTKEQNTFKFKNLMDTFCVDMQRAQGGVLNVGVLKPMNVGGPIRLENVENVAVRVENVGGAYGSFCYI